MGLSQLDKNGDSMPHFAGTTGSSVADATVMPIIMAALADGRDGDADLDGINPVPWATLSGSTYTCIRVPVPRNLWVRAGITLLTVQHHGPLCSGDVLIDGTVAANGNAAAAAVAGAATAAVTFPATGAGGAGGAAGGANNGVQAAAATVESPTSGRWFGGAGGAGAGTSGGIIGGITSVVNTRGTTHGMAAALAAGLYLSTAGVLTVGCGSGGSGGGGDAAGAGGGGGASGGMIYMSGRTLTVSSTGLISTNGGAGAAGGTNGGGGTGGAGGRIMLTFGTITLSDFLLSVQVRAGASGAAGSGASPGSTGLPGEVIYLAGKPSPMSSRHSRVAMTSAEYGAAIAAGILDISGSFVVGSDAGRATGVLSTATGGGGFSVFELTTSDGLASLRFDPSDFTLKLRVRGTDVLTTADVNAVTAGTCFQPFLVGDTIDWRVWYDPAGGARSMGIRWFVNRTGGLDEVGVASGSALAAATAGTALSTSTTVGSWGPAPSYIRAAKSAAVVGTICLLGDSIIAPRKNSIGWDGVCVGSRLSLSTQVCVSLAKPGGAFADQLTTWQGSAMRANASVVAVLIQLGHNDVDTALSEATITTNAQALVNDIVAQNPNAKIIISKITPARAHWTAAKQAVWAAVNDDIAGTGGTPITGVHARATAHVATMGDANFALQERSENADHRHPNYWGRALDGRSIRAAYDTTGLAA